MDITTANPDLGATTHTALDRSNPVFTWNYTAERLDLTRLYAKAKASQWDAADLPWQLDVDQERMAVAEASLFGGFSTRSDLAGGSFARWGDREWTLLGIEAQNWILSNFLHGEQGALLCCGKLIEAVPWIEAKYFAATQAIDEARHVEVFTRYLDDKLCGHYPINVHLEALLDDVLADARWDVTYLGMQVLVEGLALAGFGVLRQLAVGVGEPLLAELLHRVMVDEARHVAFGVVSLREVYAGLSAPEIRERQEFAYEAALRMRDRFLGQEVWERVGVPAGEAKELVEQLPELQMFRQMLFAKVVPNCSKLGLLDAGARDGEPGWLRQRFAEMGVIAFESLPADDGTDLPEMTPA